MNNSTSKKNRGEVLQSGRLHFTSKYIMNYILINIFLTLYIGINLVGGERGLISFFEKQKIYEKLLQKETVLNQQTEDFKKKIKMITNNDIDYLDMLYREKLSYGTKDQIIIKLK